MMFGVMTQNPNLAHEKGYNELGMVNSPRIAQFLMSKIPFLGSYILKFQVFVDAVHKPTGFHWSVAAVEQRSDALKCIDQVPSSKKGRKKLACAALLEAAARLVS